MAFDLAHSKLMKGVQRLASYVGLGLVCTDDVDYEELCQAYRAITIGHRRADLATVMSTFCRDYYLERPGGIRLKRKDVEDALRTRFQSQIQSDYREEPAHFIIRGRKAQIASRIYSTSICRRDGKLVELKERGEHLTDWRRSKIGWRRTRTRVRIFEQDTEWLPEPTQPEPQRVQKFVV